MIRLAKIEEKNQIMSVYQKARIYMHENGNKTQWGISYPSEEIVQRDIQQQQLYVCSEQNQIYGVFVFFIGKEPTYSYIEEGSWKNNSPYGVIHRIASDGKGKGLFFQCMNFCSNKINNLRMDTHMDNKKMQYLLNKYGFEKCGIIYVKDGSKRIAYQYTR